MNTTCPLVDRSRLAPVVEEVVDAAAQHESVHVKVGPGGGKTWLGRQLAERLDGAILIEALPSSEVDVAADATLQALAPLHRGERRREGLAALRSHPRTLAEWVPAERPVVLVLPDDWAHAPEGRVPTNHHVRSRFRALQDQILGPGRRWALVGPRSRSVPT